MIKAVLYTGLCITRINMRLKMKLPSLQSWTETYVEWSPHGTYLATFHQKGIAVWGGFDFRRLQRFNHPGVQLIDFSPCER